MEIAQPIIDTVTVTWPLLVKHVFDSVWGVVGASLGSFLAGWLLMNKPGFMRRKGTKEPG